MIGESLPPLLRRYHFRCVSCGHRFTIDHAEDPKAATCHRCGTGRAIEWWMKELVKPSQECLDERSSPQGSATAEKPPSSPMVGANPAEPTPHHPRKVGA